MKKILLSTVLVVMAISAAAQAVGDAFYIYRNDGGFNAFFREEVDSIVYSNYDNDSIWYDDVVTQVVYTPDSIYRIPLAAVDSVGFVTPETKYQPGVKRIDGELRSYVLSVDSLTIYLSTSMPTSILPQTGDKLVTTEMDDVFPIGFAGEVVDVKHEGGNIAVECTAVSIEDIFEYYYGMSQIEWDGQRIKKREGNKSPHRVTFSPGKLTLPLLNDFGFTNSYQPNDELSFDLSSLKADISVTPTVQGNAFYIVNPLYGVYFSVTVTGDYALEENFSLKGGVSWKKDIELIHAPWPILPLVDVYLEIGGFLQAGGEFAIEQQWTQHYRSAFHWEYSSKGEEMLKPVNKMIPVSSNHSGQAAVKGYIGVGFYLEVGLDFIHTKKLDIANVNLRGEAGVNLEGDLVLYKSDMETAKTSTAVYEQLRDTELSLNWFYGVSANASILKWGVSHDINLGNLPLNNQGRIFTCAMAPTFSNVEADWSMDNTSIIDAQAKIYCPAWLGGRCIISDAGLVLKVESGDDIIRSYIVYGYDGSQGERNMYSQFYNVEKGKGYKVYPFINWMGCEILASPYAEVEGELFCPDGNHPHMIDLGLPSGTKWACCNVGATTPEGYGGYFAWGETEEKDYYWWSTYIHCDGNYDTCHDLGDDIAGTQYDVAHVKWGGSWVMPSLDQIKELLNNSTSKWVTENGVNGRRFTGSNGGSIFLPAAGGRWYDDPDDAGFSGVYWSSTQNPWNSGGAYFLFFYSDNAYWDFIELYYGSTVRPVSR